MRSTPGFRAHHSLVQLFNELRIYKKKKKKKIGKEMCQNKTKAQSSE